MNSSKIIIITAILIGIITLFTTCNTNIQQENTTKTLGVSWNTSGNYTYNLVSIDPINATTGINITCSVYADFKNYSSNYANGTNYTIMFSYFINKVNKNLYNTLQTANKTPIIVTANKTLPGTLTKRGDEIFCRVKMSTGAVLNETQSPLLTSNIIIINNTKPIITSVTPNGNITTPALVYINYNTPVTLKWSVTDPDNDTLLYQLYNNDTYNYCYQESANITNQSGTDGNCGLNYTGNYKSDGTWLDYPPYYNTSYVYDGNVNTCGVSAVESSKLYINYTKPIYYMNNSLWKVVVGDKNTGTIITNNYTIPTTCISQTQIQFYVEINGSSLNQSGYCYNGTTWINIYKIRTAGVSTCVREEGMMWSIGYKTIQNSTNTTYQWNDATNQTKIYSWYITATDNRSITTSQWYYFNISFINWSIKYSPNITSFMIRPNASNGTFYPVNQTGTYGTFNITNYENTTINISTNLSKGIPKYIDMRLYGDMGITPFICYQESANITNQTGKDGSCNLNYTGSAKNIVGDPGNQWTTLAGYTPIKMNDGNWSTFSYAFDDSTRTAYFYITYIKPIYASNTSLWQVKNDLNTTESTHNLTIPYSCWNYSNKNLTFRMESFFSIPLGYLGSESFYCYNGSWNLMNTSGLYYLNGGIYDEAMYWNISRKTYDTSIIKNIELNTTTNGSTNETYILTIEPNTTLYIYAKAIYNNSGIGGTYNFSWKATK